MHLRQVFVAALVVLGGIAVRAQSPKVLYTWSGTGDTRMWVKSFGTNDVALTNDTDGQLTITENGVDANLGTGWAIGDDGNVLTEAEGAKSTGGLDLTGLTTIEFDLGHSGPNPVSVQFFVQATPGYTFKNLGPDQDITPGDPKTYQAPLDGLLPEEIAHIKVVGVNVRDHVADGNLIWTLKEVRSAGSPAASRDFATHEPGTPEGGLQGAYVNFDNNAVQGNDGGQNQTGLTVNSQAPPVGNTGSLEWVDLATGNGAAITWGNGTAFNGNSFNERPSDMSNYTKVVVRMAATNVTPEAVVSVDVGYFIQSGGFNFHTAGPNQPLPADGDFHELEFPITNVPDLDFVEAHGINLQPHAAGDLVIDVDVVRAQVDQFTDCNGNGVPDERDLVEGKSKDCNSNKVPDECDISSGTSKDCDGNGIPDECDVAAGSAARVLYTWAGTGDTRTWVKSFGDNEISLTNDNDGELTITETLVGADGRTGAFWAAGDGFNQPAEDSLSQGGLDLTGLEALEFDLGHDGVGDVNVQFYLQATPAFDYVALGPDLPVKPGMATYTVPLSGLTGPQAAYIRAIGINVRAHEAEGNLTWTLQELRATGKPLSRRDFATHEPGTSDGGLNGAAVAFDQGAIVDNDGGQNQTGLSLNTGATPPGNTGSLHWKDLAGNNGGAVAWFNGTAFGGNSFNERTADLSPFGKVTVRMAATNITPDAVSTLVVAYFLQTENFNFHSAGETQELPVDGQFHELVFSIKDIPGRAYTDAHGIDLGDHTEGDLTIDVDFIRADATAATAADCNANGVPDSCDIASGTSKDCNKNAIPDECDLASGVLVDLDGNGVPDSCEAAAKTFRRGDSNADGKLDLADAVHLLSYLFQGGEKPICLDAADCTDDGKLDLSDPIYALSYLFQGGAAPPDPGPGHCGPDPTEDDLTDCDYPSDKCN